MKTKLILFSLCAVFFSALRSEAQVTRWYSYADYQANNTPAVDGGYLQLWNDTTSLLGYIDAISGLPTYSLNGFTSDGLSFAPVLNTWNDASIYGSTIKVGPGDAYTIDSVRVYGAYLRNNAKPLVKDTLRLAFVYGNGNNTTNLPQYFETGSTPALYGVDTLKWLQMMYDSTRNIAGRNPGVVTTPYVQSIVLGTHDTTSFGIAWPIALATPYSVPAGSSAAMSLTFKSGDATYHPFDTVQYASGDVKYGEFFSVVQYAGSAGSYSFPIYDTADKNVGYFGSPIASNSPWGGLYIPNWGYTYGGVAATGLQYPVIEYHINCPTCDLNDSIAGTLSVCAGSTTALSFSATGGTWSSSNTFVATVNSSGTMGGVSFGTATITYNLSGHHSYSTVTVNSLPSAITGTMHACVGATTTLSSSPSGSWTSGTISVATVSGSTVYGAGPGTTVITNTNTATGCGITAIFTVNPLPASITGTTSVCIGATTTLHDATVPGTWSSSSSSAASVSSTGVVTGGGATGSATITYTAAGCSTSASVIVLTAPTTAGTITGSSVLCAGASTTLNDGAASGTWSSTSTAIATVDGFGIVHGVSGGSVTISYTVANICGSIGTSTSITINPLPDAGIITGLVTICQGDTATLSDVAGSGTWSSTNSSIATITSSGLVTGVSAGAATISYTVSNDCGTLAATQAVNVLSTATCLLSVTNTGNSQNEITIYPNPNRGTFTLNILSQNNEQAHIVISNIVGEKVKEFTAATNNITDVQLNQAPGVYLLSVTTTSGKYVGRIVVE